MVKEDLFLLGSKDKIGNFKKHCYSISRNKKMKLYDFAEINANLDRFKTIVLLDDNYDEFFSNFSYLISEKTEIITASKWCERNLQRIPIEYLTPNDLDINTFIN